MEINVLIDDEFKGELKEDWLRTAAAQILNAQGAGSGVEMGLVITGQEKVRELNRDYRGKDEPTDVLSFCNQPPEADSPTAPFIMPPDGITHLGEVILSHPQAVIQAGEHGHSTRDEILTLLIHGVLHLLGYDHEQPAEEREMKAREAEIFSRIRGSEG